MAEQSTDPKGNVTLKVYDKSGRLWKVTSGRKTATYSSYSNDSRASTAYSDGAREEYTYYGNGSLCILTNKKADGIVMGTYSYTYDAADNQTARNVYGLNLLMRSADDEEYY